MTNKNIDNQGRQCHAKHRSGQKERAKGRGARGNDLLRAYVRSMLI